MATGWAPAEAHSRYWQNGDVQKEIAKTIQANLTADAALVHP